MADAVLEGPCRVSLTVLLELGWVLDRVMRLPRRTVAQMLGSVAALDTLTVEQGDRLSWAIARYEAGADWADAVHLIANADAATAFVTFDRELARQAGRSAPLAVETL